MNKSGLVLITIALVLGMGIGGVPYVNAQEEFSLEEITVTAEKRVTNIQDTSMAIAVVDGIDIIEKSMETLHDVLKEVPNLMTVETGLGPKISIRGVGQDMPIGVGESPIATNFDGVYQMRWEVGQFGFFDVDRVEVLRGPQGMLYGRNATGGVVNVISSKPKPDVVEGQMAVDIGEYDLLKGQGAINVPISNNFAGRLAFVASKGGGYTEDIGGGRDTQYGLGLRAQLRYEPSDEVSVNLMASYISRTGRRWGAVTVENWNAGNYYINDQDYPWNRAADNKYKNSRYVLTAEFPVGPGVVTFLPSYERISQSSASVGANRMTGEVEVTLGGMLGYKTSSAELRYASKEDARIQWVGGLYYTDTDEPGRLRTPPPVAIKWYKSYAAFGQIVYPFSDTLRGIVGARTAKDDKGYTDYELTPETASFNFRYFDWKLGIEKDFTENIMNYLTLSTGHRPGGYAERTGLPFKMESLISAEWGLKSRFMDNRLQVNGDIYYYDYKDFQVTDVWIEIDPDTGQPEMFNNFWNVDKVGNYGAELEISSLLARNTKLDFAITFLHARYEADFYKHETAFSPVADNLNGKPLPHSPDFTIRGSIDHTFFLSDGSVLKPRVSFRWFDDQYVAPVISRTNLQEAYSIVDASLTFDSTHNWTLNFYANNALDKVYASGIGFAAAGQVYFPGNPRQMGITFNMRF